MIFPEAMTDLDMYRQFSAAVGVTTADIHVEPFFNDTSTTERPLPSSAAVPVNVSPDWVTEEIPSTVRAPCTSAQARTSS